MATEQTPAQTPEEWKDLERLCEEDVSHLKGGVYRVLWQRSEAVPDLLRSLASVREENTEAKDDIRAKAIVIALLNDDIKALTAENELLTLEIQTLNKLAFCGDRAEAAEAELATLKGRWEQLKNWSDGILNGLTVRSKMVELEREP